MTATAVDTMTVAAIDKADAPDIARRQWETFGFRIVQVIEVTPGTKVGTWRVTAHVELVR